MKRSVEEFFKPKEPSAFTVTKEKKEEKIASVLLKIDAISLVTGTQ